MEGLGHLLNTMGLIKTRLNPTLTLGGILLTMYDSRNLLSRRVSEDVRSNFGDRVFKTVIPRNVRLSESPSHGLPIILYDIKSRGAVSYMELAREIIEQREDMMPPKHSLGKGLGAMFPDLLNNIGDKPAFILCGIEELTPNRFQPRRAFNDADQNELVASVRKSGIIQPIVVRKSENGYEIIAGERRWRAAQAAGLKEVPIIIRTADDRELAELSLIENIQREALNPVEEADAYQTLMTRFSLSQEEIAARVGKDRSTIANTVRLLKLPEAVKKALIGKAITAGHARALLALDAPGEQIAAL